MRTVLLAMIGFCASLQAVAAGCDQPPFAAAMQSVSAEHHAPAPTLASCELIAGHPDAGAALFAYEQDGGEEGLKTFDVELLVVDAKSGAIEARLSRRRVWDSDAYKIDSAAISDAEYPLRAGATIFGVTEDWSGSSSVSFYNIRKLSLFERKGKSIVPLLSEFVTDIYQGEGCDLQTTRELQPQAQRGKGYAALRVVEKLSSVAREGESCEIRDEQNDREVLRFQAGKYPVPKSMRAFAE